MTTRNDATDTNDQHNKPERNTTNVPSHGISKSIPFLVSIAISAAIGILYTNLHITKQADQFVTEIHRLKQQQIDMQTVNKLELAAIEQRFGERLIRVNKALESALQERWYQSSDWVMLKARYYLELATIHAHWSNDLPTISALLKDADTLLASIQGEQLSEVRQAIAKEQTELLQIPPIDITGILAQLDAIQHVINTLTPQKPLTSITTNQNTPTDKTTPHTWREHVKASLQKLKTLIIIRHQDDTVTPLLTPAYVTMLCETIRLNLQETQWAVLEHNQAIYQLSLTQVIDHINRVFDPKDPQTLAIINQLKTLQSMTLTQPKPVLGKSLQLLNNIINAKSTNTVGEPS